MKHSLRVSLGLVALLPALLSTSLAAQVAGGTIGQAAQGDPAQALAAQADAKAAAAAAAAAPSGSHVTSVDGKPLTAPAAKRAASSSTR